MKGFLSLIASLAAAAAVASGSVGVYAPELLPGAGLEPGVWEKYDQAAVGPRTSARVQSFYDMMCERVDLFAPDYAYAADKRDTEIGGCPSPDRRRALVEEPTGVPQASVRAALYADMCDWLARDPAIETTASTPGRVYPDWQSPLCRDIRLLAVPDGLSTKNTDVYPCSLSHFGYPGVRRTDIADALSNLTARLGVSYTDLDRETAEHTVTFQANGGSGGSLPDPVTGRVGTLFRVPGDGGLTRSGFVFAGWVGENGVIYPEGGVYTFARYDELLKANWKQIYTVTFAAGGGAGELPAPVSGIAGTQVPVPGQGGLTRDGYAFTGWKSGAGVYYAAGTSFIFGSNNETLTAQWNYVPHELAGVGAALGSPDIAFYSETPDAFYVDSGSGRVRSPYIPNSGKSTMFATVTGPVRITFVWGVSSENNYDWLTFRVDGVQVDRISGDKPSLTKTHDVGAGQHRVEWTYSKDGGGTYGSDCGWLTSFEARRVLASALSAPIKALSTADVYEKPDIDFCGYYDGDTRELWFVDEIEALAAGSGAIPWAAVNGFDRICTDLASRNVAIVDLTPYATYEGRTRKSTYSYRFDHGEIAAWLSEYGHYEHAWVDEPSRTFQPALEETESTVTTNYVLSAPWASANVSPKQPVATSGRYVFRGNYVMHRTGEDFYYYGDGETPDGHHYDLYQRYAYSVESVPGVPQLIFNDTPRCDIAVTAEDVFIDLGTNEVFAANRAFDENPSYFAGTKATVVAASSRSLFIPEAGFSTNAHEIAFATTSCPNARVTQEITGGFASALKVQDAELEGFEMSPGGLTFTLTPAHFDDSYEIYECRAILDNGATMTIAGRNDGYDHFPVYNGHGGWNGPDASKGETYPSVNWDGRTVGYSYAATFTSAYDAPPVTHKGSIIKGFSKPAAVFENRYAFTSWSVPEDEKEESALALLGPQSDYGDGDGGIADFDVVVGGARGLPSYIPRFSDIDEAIKAVNPDGGSYPVTNRIAKIGVSAGSYPFPVYFKLSQGGRVPYPVRLIGIGADTVLEKPNEGSGGYNIEFDQFSWLENLTINTSYNRNALRRSLCSFVIVNCRLTGDHYAAYYPFIEGSYVYKTVCTNLTSYVSEAEARQLIYGSTVEDCAFFVKKRSNGPIEFCQWADIYDCIVIGGDWKAVYTSGGSGDIGGMTYATVHMDTVVDTLSPPASNCLFFVDGLLANHPRFAGSIVMRSSDFAAVVNPLTLRPREEYHTLWSKGYHGAPETPSVMAFGAHRTPIQMLSGGANGGRSRRGAFRCKPPTDDTYDKEDKE